MTVTVRARKNVKKGEKLVRRMKLKIPSENL